MNKIDKKIGVVGLGYVGLPVALAFSKKFPVIGFDINKKRIEALQQNEDYTGEVSSRRAENDQHSLHNKPHTIKRM